MRRSVEPDERLAFARASVDEDCEVGRETEAVATRAEEGGGTRVGFRQAPFDAVARLESPEEGCGERLDDLVRCLGPGRSS